jgi:hypothetical protein
MGALSEFNSAAFHCYWPGRIARPRPRLERWVGPPAKLASLLRGIASKRNILVRLDNQRTHAHTTTPSARNYHWHSQTLDQCSIGALDLPPGCALAPIQLLLPCAAARNRSHRYRHSLKRRPTASRAPFSAALRVRLARPTRPTPTLQRSRLSRRGRGPCTCRTL